MTTKSYQKETLPAAQPVPIVCGMCSYHRTSPSAHCSLRVAADLDYITFTADSTHAQQCPFFIQTYPF
jgi:hypothetical protein